MQIPIYTHKTKQKISIKGQSGNGNAFFPTAHTTTASEMSAEINMRNCELLMFTSVAFSLLLYCAPLTNDRNYIQVSEGNSEFEEN